MFSYFDIFHKNTTIFHFKMVFCFEIYLDFRVKDPRYKLNVLVTLSNFSPLFFHFAGKANLFCFTLTPSKHFSS